MIDVFILFHEVSREGAEAGREWGEGRGLQLIFTNTLRQTDRQSKQTRKYRRTYIDLLNEGSLKYNHELRYS